MLYVCESLSEHFCGPKNPQCFTSTSLHQTKSDLIPPKYASLPPSPPPICYRRAVSLMPSLQGSPHVWLCLQWGVPSMVHPASVVANVTFPNWKPDSALALRNCLISPHRRRGCPDFNEGDHRSPSFALDTFLDSSLHLDA